MKVCQCCGNLQQDAHLPCCQSLDDINLGVGVQLYFMSLAHHAIILTVGFFLYALYSLITNSIASGINTTNFQDLCTVSGGCGLAALSSGAKAV